MDTKNNKETTDKTSFVKWYEENSQTFNNRRRERYQADKSYREKARLRAAEYRARKREERRQNHQVQTRFLNGVEVPVLTISEVAAELKCSPERLRYLERKNWIPETVFGEYKRLYTKAQVGLIRQIIDAIDLDLDTQQAINEAKAKWIMIQ